MKKINLNKLKSKSAKRISLAFSLLFILLFIVILGVSIYFTKMSYPNIEVIEGAKTIDWFSSQISNSYGMNIPFSIFIQLITTIGGVFFGIRIDQWIDTKSNNERKYELWKRINIFLNQLNIGIKNDKNIYELFEYKIYWESIQNVDQTATKLLQENEKYSDLAFVFSFLHYYKGNWSNFESISQWSYNASDEENKRIDHWKNSIEELIKYTETKI